jgi:predicted lipoprotein with Yx(FWY)xxD motif
MNDRPKGRPLRLSVTLVVAGVLAAACGGSSGGNKAAQVTANNPATSSAASSDAGSRVSVTTHKGPMGTYLTGAGGRSLYMFAGDSGSQSACNGACAVNWPPLVGAAAQTSGAANDADTGTITRGDGSTQITYGGHPLYYYAGDSKAGDTNGQDLDANGGKWWLVAPSGKPITAAASSSSSSSSTGSGWS